MVYRSYILGIYSIWYTITSICADNQTCKCACLQRVVYCRSDPFSIPCYKQCIYQCKNEDHTVDANGNCPTNGMECTCIFSAQQSPICVLKNNAIERETFLNKRHLWCMNLCYNNTYTYMHSGNCVEIPDNIKEQRLEHKRYLEYHGLPPDTEYDDDFNVDVISKSKETVQTSTHYLQFLLEKHEERFNKSRSEETYYEQEKKKYAEKKLQDEYYAYSYYDSDEENAKKQDTTTIRPRAYDRFQHITEKSQTDESPPVYEEDTIPAYEEVGDVISANRTKIKIEPLRPDVKKEIDDYLGIGKDIISTTKKLRRRKLAKKKELTAQDLVQEDWAEDDDEDSDYDESEESVIKKSMPVEDNLGGKSESAKAVEDENPVEEEEDVVEDEDYDYGSSYKEGYPDDDAQRKKGKKKSKTNADKKTGKPKITGKGDVGTAKMRGRPRKTKITTEKNQINNLQVTSDDGTSSQKSGRSKNVDKLRKEGDK